MKTLRIEDALHRDLKVEAAHRGSSIEVLAHLFLSKTVPKSKHRQIGNGKQPTKKKEIVYG